MPPLRGFQKPPENTQQCSLCKAFEDSAPVLLQFEVESTDLLPKLFQGQSFLAVVVLW